SEDLTAGQITPLFGADNAAGLKPAICRIEFSSEIGSGSSGRGDSSRFGYHTQDLLADSVNPSVVGAHALHHDLLVDVDHVRMPDLAAIDHLGHLHTRFQLVGLHLNGKDTNLAILELFQYLGRHLIQWTLGKLLEHKGAKRRTGLYYLVNNTGSD